VRAEWETVPLNAVATLDIERVKVQPADGYRLVGVLIAGQGLFWRDTIQGRETNYTTLHRLKAGQLVMRKLTAWEGPITTVPPEFDGGYVSSEFPTFTLDETRVLPAFMRLICQQPSFHAEMRLRSTGTAERRNRLKPDDLLSIEIELPSIDEQRAVVVVASAIEAGLDALHAESDAAFRLHASLREELISNADWGIDAFSSVLAGIDAGKSPKCEERPPAAEEWGVLKVSAIRPGQFRASEAKVLSPGVEFPERAKVRRGDVLTTRASGSLQLVGSVCRVEEEPGNLILSDKTLRLRVDEEKADPLYIVEALATLPVRAQIEQEASGSSGQKNVSQSDLNSLAVPLPASEEQRVIARKLAAVRAAAQFTAGEAEQLASVRTSLLESLLSGERRIRGGESVT
jgi:type I restriction enzyme S subunit